MEGLVEEEHGNRTADEVCAAAADGDPGAWLAGVRARITLSAVFASATVAASGVLRLNVPHGSILAIPGAGGSGAPFASEGGISSPSAEDDAPPLSTSRPGASAATDCAGPIDNLARFTVSIASAAVIPFCAATYPNARANVSNVSRRSPHGVASANATSSAPTSKPTSNTSALRANRVHR